MDTILEHQVYKHILSKAPAGALVQKGYLQLEIALQNGKPTYNFAVNETTQVPAQRASERRLNNNNAFVSTRFGLYLKRENPNQPGSAVLQSYANIQVFPDAAGEVANADLESIFNSFLSVKVGDTVFADAIDLRESRNVRTTQQSAATNRSEQLGTDGQIDMEPIITLDGGKNNLVSVTIPSWAGQLIQYAAGSNQNYLVLKFWGFLVTNGSGIGALNNG